MAPSEWLRRHSAPLLPTQRTPRLPASPSHHRGPAEPVHSPPQADLGQARPPPPAEPSPSSFPSGALAPAPRTPPPAGPLAGAATGDLTRPALAALLLFLRPSSTSLFSLLPLRRHGQNSDAAVLVLHRHRCRRHEPAPLVRSDGSPPDLAVSALRPSPLRPDPVADLRQVQRLIPLVAASVLQKRAPRARVEQASIASGPAWLQGPALPARPPPHRRSEAQCEQLPPPPIWA